MTETVVSKIKTEIVVSGDSWDPDELTRNIGIEPIEITRKGEERPNGRPPAPNTSWSIDSPWMHTDNIEDPVKIILSQVSGKENQIAKFAKDKELKVDLVIIVEIYDDRPELYLNSEIINTLALLKAAVGFDMYDFSAPEQFYRGDCWFSMKNTIPCKIYIPLLNEGVEVLRPTTGEKVKENVFRVNPTDDYNSEDEEWKFLPGSVVRCEKQEKGGKVI